MTICGYNDLMGKGIRILFEGMYEAVRAKSEAEGVPFSSVLERELVEIPQINCALASRRSNTLSMFLGLNQMALAHFVDLLSRDPAKSGAKEAFMFEVDNFIATLRRAEDHSMSVPLAHGASREIIAVRAQQIGEWIAENLTVASANIE